jgi:hypothetical protein
MIDTNVKETFYEKLGIEEDNEGVSAERALKMMAAICCSYSCTQNDFQLYEVYNKDDLIDAIMGHVVSLVDNDEYIYTKVREIFNQEEED